MIPKTQKTLRAARFFLQDLQKRAWAFRSDPEEFEFVLNAFLSAARSVTFVLKKEEKAKYVSWFEPVWMAKLSKSKDDELFFRGMKNRRNAAEKEGDAGVSLEWEYSPIWQFSPSDRRHPAYGLHYFGPVGIEPPLHGHFIHYFDSPDSKVKAVDACSRYFALLDQLVREFIEQHACP